MNFKDQLDKDIEETFINFDEFAEEHKIGKKIAKCVIDEDLFQTKQQRKVTISGEEGIYISGITLFIHKTFFKFIPHSGEILLIDDEKYTVITCKKDMNLLEIDLERYEEI